MKRTKGSTGDCSRARGAEHTLLANATGRGRRAGLPLTEGRGVHIRQKPNRPRVFVETEGGVSVAPNGGWRTVNGGDEARAGDPH